MTEAPGAPQARPKVLLLGPARGAVSGVSTHLNMLFASSLAQAFELLHFQVGAEGRQETALRRLGRFLGSPLQFAAVLIRQRPAIVHVNTSMDRKAFWRDLIYLFIAKALGRRVVYQVHGGALPADFFRASVMRTRILLETLLLADAVLVLSAEELSAYQAFAPKAQVQKIANAINPDGLLDRQRNWNTDSPLRLVYVGRLVRAKGIFEIVEALAALKRKGQLFNLTIAGEGPERSALAAAIERCGVADQVRMLGSVFGADKNKLWLESDVFLLPTCAEGLPYTLLECMAAGCVAVASRVGAIPDVVEDGVSGLLVQAQDVAALVGALQFMAAERHLLKQFGSNARARIASHYTLPRLAHDIDRIYRLVLPCGSFFDLAGRQ